MSSWMRALAVSLGLALLCAGIPARAGGSAPVAQGAAAASGLVSIAQRGGRAPRTKLFGAPGGCNGFVYAMVATPGGLLYLGGDFSACEEVLAANVVAYDPRTRRFQALGSGTANGVNVGAFGGVYALALQGSDLIVGGFFSEAGGLPARSIARWNGSTWATLGSGEQQGVNGSVYDLAVNGSEIYVGGNYTHAGGAPAESIALWNGSAWSTLGSGVGGRGDAAVYALHFSGGVLHVGGLFNSAGGVSARNVARFDANGWTGLGSGTDGTVNSLEAFAGEIYVGGQYAQAGGQPANALARWNGSAWSVVGSPAAQGVAGGVLQLYASGGNLYVSGYFSQAGDQAANAVARWDGSRWFALGSGELNGTNNTTWALASIGDELFAGGEFDQAGTVQASFVASFDGSAWRAPGSGIGNGVNNTIDALAVLGNDLYAGGAFTLAGGAPASRIARWNGSRWSALGSAETNGVDSRVLALAALGTDIYVGGYFGNAGGRPASLIARWNGSSFEALGSGLGGEFPSVLAIKAVGSDLYVGGEFTLAGGQTANKIARWNGNTWSALGSGAANGVTASNFVGVHAIEALGNEIHVAGAFTSAGGQPAFGVARWNGSSWSSLGSGAANGVNNTAYALAATGSDLYVGGAFSEAGGEPASGVARWDGNRWHPLGTPEVNGVNGSVRAIVISGSDVYVGGSFTLAGGRAANGLARWNGSSWEGLAVGAPPQTVRAMVIDRGSLYAGGAGLSQTPLPDLQSGAPGGALANGPSRSAVASRAGTRISFASDAGNLTADDGNGRSDVFVRDPVTGSLTRASAAAEAVNGGAAESFSAPALSADGARIAFAGSSGQLYAVVDGAARVLSRSAAGTAGDGPSGRPQLPGSGSLAVFDSQAANLLAAADGNGAVSDIFSVDMASRAVSLVSVAPGGAPADGPSSGPWASDDGRQIAFSTLATNLVPGVATAKAGTVRQAMVMSGSPLSRSGIYVSRNLASGALGNGDSINVRLTPDGRYGVFESQASNLVDGDSNGVADVFRFELNEARTAMIRLERVSVSRFGFQADGASRNPGLCDDGQFVGFETDASNLIELDRNGAADILVKWLVTGEVVRLSRTVDGNQPNGASSQPSLSGDCSTIVFASAASNLTPNDSNSASDVFSVALRERTPTLVTGPTDEPGVSGYPLPVPNPPHASCPAGFFIATVDDGPGAGLTPGIFGVELLLDAPGTRLLDGGLNFGGLIDLGQVGFAGFNFTNAANEMQRVTLSLTGSPAAGSGASLPVRISLIRQTSAGDQIVYESLQSINLTTPFTHAIDLTPGFYVATVAATGGEIGGAAEGQFFLGMQTNFVNRPGGGFQGGAVVGGYHAANPSGGVSGFAGFCLGSAHATSIRVLSRPTYGASGAKDLRLKLLDAQQREIVVVPAG